MDAIDLGHQHCDLLCGPFAATSLGDQSSGLCGFGEGDTLANRRGQQGRIMVSQCLGRFAGDDGARTAAVQQKTGGEFRAIDACFVQKRQHLS